VVAPLAAAAPSAPRGIVTPEAVVLEFDTAGVPSRAIARTVDAFVVLFALSTVSGVFAPLVGSDANRAAIVAILVVLVVIFGYPCACETIWGRTLGHLLFGLRVVTEEGGPVRFRHAVVRSLMQVVDIFLVPIGVIAVIASLTSPRDQRLGDRLAGTLVIRMPAMTAQSSAIAFPPLPGYEGYVASLDTGRLTTDAYEVLRSFLTRVDDLTPAARSHLAGRLVEPIGSVVGQRPPSSMGAEVFLASVAAAYQRRNGGPATWAWGPMGRPPPLLGRR
jgi:uncharacterized RDD family membrane protein YckC